MLPEDYDQKYENNKSDFLKVHIYFNTAGSNIRADMETVI